METEEKRKEFVESRSMKKYNKTLFRMDMQQIDCESILGPSEGDPAGMAATFQDVLESVLNLHAPYVRKGYVVNMPLGSLLLLKT